MPQEQFDVYLLDFKSSNRFCLIFLAFVEKLNFREVEIVNLVKTQQGDLNGKKNSIRVDFNVLINPL